jgi:pimeloyl-ACP methyl ester carboxylesterase
MHLTESVLERMGCPLPYWVGGPEGRPWVVLTHGAGVDHHSFDLLVPLLAERYRVMTWDVRGHGLSRPMGRDFTLPLAVDDLLAILDRLGADQAVFIGHSNGTYIAQELAFRHPQRVQALVIADGTCITWPHSPPTLFLLRHSAAVMWLIPFQTLKKAGLQAFSNKADVREYVYRAFSLMSRRDFITIWDGVVKGLHPEPTYRIAQPLLLTHGDADRTGDIRKIAPRWAKREPNCTYVVVPNARHFALLDNAEFFNRIVSEFLRTVAPVEP